MLAKHDLIIRPADTSDLNEVARVWHESAAHMHGANPGMPSLLELRQRIDVELHAGWKLYIAQFDKQIAGMLALKPDEAVLDQLFVQPNAQGEGIGRALLALAKEAMPTGFTLRLSSSNSKARVFYEKGGLRVVREGMHPRSGAPVCFYSWRNA